jgi:hypothetical protein
MLQPLTELQQPVYQTASVCLSVCLSAESPHRKVRPADGKTRLSDSHSKPAAPPRRRTRPADGGAPANSVYPSTHNQLEFGDPTARPAGDQGPAVRHPSVHHT